MTSFLDKLKQRQVFKVATIYAVSAWPLIQIADLAVPAIGLPDSVMTLLLQLFLIGFPVVLLFSWLYNFTATGIVRATRDTQDHDDNSQVNVQTTVGIVGILITVLLVTLATQYFYGENTQQSVLPQSTVATKQVISPSVVAERPSIAILPFASFSQDAADEFFADGMVEELLNLLAKSKGLQVAARTSSFAYKGVSNKTISQIGRELGVDTILEGSIRKNDVTNQIRVTAQLVKVDSGEHLWSETFDREYRDIFQIQDDIARAVVDKMKQTLLGVVEPVNVAITSKSHTRSVDAMVAYGKGQQELQHRTIDSLNKALEHFEQAIAYDQEYARAYVGLADANLLLALYGNLSQDIASERAGKALENALTLDSELGEAYASLGLLWSVKDDKKAEQYYQQALEFAPNYAMAYMWYGSTVQNLGDYDKSHQLFKRAFELDPKSPVAAYNVALGYYQLGDEGKAMEMFSHIIANDPYYPSAYNLVADILADRGRLDESIQMYSRAIEVDPINKNALNGLVTKMMDLRDPQGAKKWLDYISSTTEIFTEMDQQLLQVRYLASQGELTKAIELLALVKPSSHDRQNTILAGELAFYQQQYAKVINTYQALSEKTEPRAFANLLDGQVIIHLIYAYMQLEQQDLADSLIADYEQIQLANSARNQNNPDYFFNMASIRAMQNQPDEVRYYLQAAIDAGWTQTWSIAIEPYFAPMADDQQFVAMLGGVNAKLDNMRRRMKDESFILAEQSFGDF